MTVNSLVLGPWLEALHPMHGKLTAGLLSILRDKNRSEATQSVAADILADYAGDDPATVAEEVLMVSNPGRRTGFSSRWPSGIPRGY